jgi:hypothetical protein
MPPNDMESYNSEIGLSVLEEHGEPQCQNDASGPFGAVADPSRRLLYIAMVNCMAEKNDLNSGARTVEVIEVLEAFMTEAADANSAGGNADMGAIYVEPIRSLPIEGSKNVVLHEIIQLY